MALLTLLKKKPAASLTPGRLPKHIAVIMDGNGRWAKARGLPRSFGHRKGVESTRHFVEQCAKLGIEEVTLYAFSSENWSRPESEVQELMELLRQYLDGEREYFLKQQARLRIIGDRARLSPDIRDRITAMEEATSGQSRLMVNVALSYGGRQELTQAMRRLAAQVQAGKLLPDAIDEQAITQALYAADMREPDLLIRTGGDRRISNFLLWQMAYTELYFTETLWPDFGEEQLSHAIADYQSRERRFGKTGEQIMGEGAAQ